MDLLFSELKNEAFQEITMLEDCNLVNIRPHILKFGNPAGSLKVQVKDSNGFLIEESNSVEISSISALTFAHGYVKFDIITPLKKDQVYRINVVAFNGYAFTMSDFAGLCKDFDLRKVEATYLPNIGFNSAYDIELWRKKMTDRQVEFFDGFTSSTQPLAGQVITTAVNSFIDDAAFVTFKGSAAEAGDIYRNSTSGLIRYNDGSVWISISFQNLEETQADINDAVGAPTNVTGLVFDSAEVRDAIVAYSMLRRNDATEKTETGILKLKFQPDAVAWLPPARETDFDNDVGVLFTINVGGQVRYTSDALGGPGYDGFIRFKTIKTFKPGV